jgi:pyruvate/2-oxoglutarate/acetoin dehydrogenase E1 component
VVMPSNPRDAKGLLKSAIREPNPVVFLEHKALYYRKGMVPDEEYLVPLCKAAVLREGSDVTIVSLAAMVPRAVDAAERLATEHGIDAEVIDLRTLIPLDAQAVLRSVAKTSRLFTVEENPRALGWGAEIVSIVVDEGFYSLDAPIVRITTPNIPLPSASVLEDLAIPTVERIVATIKRRLDEAK